VKFSTRIGGGDCRNRELKGGSSSGKGSRNRVTGLSNKPSEVIKGKEGEKGAKGVGL